MTKTQFLAAYETALRSCPWTADGAKLDRFMSSVRATLDGANTWNHDGDCCTAAWRAIGGKGKPTLRGLRALPAD